MPPEKSNKKKLNSDVSFLLINLQLNKSTQLNNNNTKCTVVVFPRSEATIDDNYH